MSRHRRAFRPIVRCHLTFSKLLRLRRSILLCLRAVRSKHHFEVPYDSPYGRWPAISVLTRQPALYIRVEKHCAFRSIGQRSWFRILLFGEYRALTAKVYYLLFSHRNHRDDRTFSWLLSLFCSQMRMQNKLGHVSSWLDRDCRLNWHQDLKTLFWEIFWFRIPGLKRK